ncbi:hypothetical protein E3N88_01458 [Mikania micrantha]|uniref:Small ribosomal subunit protein uS15 N-terminal domain-containing protein n=1 Tax=Mikania micrantha TaxID=192012 RepID=A0A5N6Q193_9ASTR|nr:hypothetical protein E3N88_01458 [Mikania micrantha]
MPDASILLLASLNLIYVLLQTKPKSFSLFVSQQFNQFSLLIRLQLHLLRFLLFRYIICKFAMKGLTPSQIGVILRDSHGIAQVNSVTRSKILRILKAYEILEDLYHLIKKAVAIRKHSERNGKDKDSKFSPSLSGVNDSTAHGKHDPEILRKYRKSVEAARIGEVTVQFRTRYMMLMVSFSVKNSNAIKIKIKEFHWV